ncbi:ABC transporter B family member 18 [Hibiscus syriacus]|uniref:ABC transporter B family member 18 n=1 Tax=Hibiscus syriacus TaxID=106335 RepID=A0A6A2Z929_HIBSY|nr:ABC transporter B family member 18 [Hibiscus syriacus]
MVGLVGGSGSGKSTIILLIESFYDPINRDILLDGHNIKKLQLKWLRSQMGLVNQEPILFATSTKENILSGKEGVSMELVVQAAKAVNAHDFIAKLPNGYETEANTIRQNIAYGQEEADEAELRRAARLANAHEFIRGAKLSGGQKQSIALARAILKNPMILLLDEATSALDSELESLVHKALEKMMVRCTCVVMAHRLSTIQKPDSIAVIKNGKVVEQGSHSGLLGMGRARAYYSLIKLQNGQYPYR